jgi:hypothetical protein
MIGNGDVKAGGKAATINASLQTQTELQLGQPQPGGNQRLAAANKRRVAQQSCHLIGMH